MATKTKIPSRVTKSRAFAHTPDEVLFCMAFQHSWRRDDSVKQERRGREGRWTKGVFVGWSCDGCTSQRRDLLGYNGALVARSWRPTAALHVKINRARGTRKEQARREWLARRG